MITKQAISLLLYWAHTTTKTQQKKMIELIETQQKIGNDITLDVMDDLTKQIK